jgi:hypothetical protein
MPTEFDEAIAATDQERGLRPSFSFAAAAFRHCSCFRLFLEVISSAHPGLEGGCNVIDPEVHKITWAQVGRVAEPGRYLFTFGWLTITDADLAVWQQYPDAAFTLVVQSPAEAVEEYRLGAFAL